MFLNIFKQTILCTCISIKEKQIKSIENAFREKLLFAGNRTDV